MVKDKKIRCPICKRYVKVINEGYLGDGLFFIRYSCHHEVYG